MSIRDIVWREGIVDETTGDHPVRVTGVLGVSVNS